MENECKCKEIAAKIQELASQLGGCPCCGSSDVMQHDYEEETEAPEDKMEKGSPERLAIMIGKVKEDLK